MTLPDERTRAVLQARRFLVELAGREIKRIPEDVRTRARCILKHFPTPYDFHHPCESFDREEAKQWRG